MPEELFAYWMFHEFEERIPKVKAVYPNRKKSTVAVKFFDGEVVVMRLRKGERWDVHTAVAYAVAQKCYGSKTAFSKAVDKAIAPEKRDVK